jgi:hypothetical protein
MHLQQLLLVVKRAIQLKKLLHPHLLLSQHLLNQNNLVCLALRENKHKHLEHSQGNHQWVCLPHNKAKVALLYSNY